MIDKMFENLRIWFSLAFHQQQREPHKIQRITSNTILKQAKAYSFCVASSKHLTAWTTSLQTRCRLPFPINFETSSLKNMKRYDRLPNEGLKGTIAHIFAHNIRQINALSPEIGIYSGHDETFEHQKISRYLFPRSDITSMWPHVTHGGIYSLQSSPDFGFCAAGDFPFFPFFGGGVFFSFLLCKVRDSAARKLNRGRKRKQFSFRAAVTLMRTTKGKTTKELKM